MHTYGIILLSKMVLGRFYHSFLEHVNFQIKKFYFLGHNQYIYIYILKKILLFLMCNKNLLNKSFSLLIMLKLIYLKNNT